MMLRQFSEWFVRMHQFEFANPYEVTPSSPSLLRAAPPGPTQPASCVKADAEMWRLAQIVRDSHMPYRTVVKTAGVVTKIVSPPARTMHERNRDVRGEIQTPTLPRVRQRIPNEHIAASIRKRERAHEKLKEVNKKEGDLIARSAAALLTYKKECQTRLKRLDEYHTKGGLAMYS